MKTDRCCSNTLVIGIVMCGVFIIGASPAFAENMGHKLGRGILNTATSWVEVPYQIEKHMKEDGAPAGATIGLFQGIGKMLKRAGVGVYEIVTFPVSIPNHYKPIITDPTYFFHRE
jgi:putative exosortase-associated protein (TIGR04073 family)